MGAWLHESEQEPGLLWMLGGVGGGGYHSSLFISWASFVPYLCRICVLLGVIFGVLFGVLFGAHLWLICGLFGVHLVYLRLIWGFIWVLFGAYLGLIWVLFRACLGYLSPYTPPPYTPKGLNDGSGPK